MKPRASASRLGKVEKVMHEYKHGELHSGSKHGPKVKSRKQAIAIAMSEQRKGEVMKKAEKKTCRVFVVTVGGKRYLYGDANDQYRYRWEWNGGVLSVKRRFDPDPPKGGILLPPQDETLLECPAQHVLAVGGPQTFFKDAWWSKE
jgi:hypothetical protein